MPNAARWARMTPEQRENEARVSRAWYEANRERVASVNRLWFEANKARKYLVDNMSRHRRKRPGKLAMIAKLEAQLLESSND